MNVAPEPPAGRSRSGGWPPRLSSPRHPLLIACRKLRRRPAEGRRRRLLLLDGVHLLEEALASPYPPRAILCAPRLGRGEAGRRLLTTIRRRGWPTWEVPDAILAGLSETQTPQGILGLFERPKPTPLPGYSSPPPVGLEALILAGLQDPRNVGALARTAYAFGARRLITLAGTADPLHPRALRASAGALLHLTLHPDMPLEELRRWVRQAPLHPVALLPHGGGDPRALTGCNRPIALLLGAEGHGLPPRLAEVCETSLSFPIREGFDSLAVVAAGSIALYLASPGQGGGPADGG
jgi:TrmH family RNA methyltransferase